MTAEELVAQRLAPLWLLPERLRGGPASDAAAMFGQRYRKADGTSLTQFNTGAIVVRENSILALTECQPVRGDETLIIAAPQKARTAVVNDIRHNGPPLLAVLFRKGATDVGRWVCSTPDEVVLNGPDGPSETAAMEDVALIASLPGGVKPWRDGADLYRQSEQDETKADSLFAAADRIAATTGKPSEDVLGLLWRLRRVPSLAYHLAAQEG